VKVQGYEPSPPCPDCLPTSIRPTPPISTTPFAGRQAGETLHLKINPVSSQQFKLAELKGTNVAKDSLAGLVKKNPDGSYSFGKRKQKGSQREPKSPAHVQQTIVKNPDGSYSILTGNRTTRQ